MLVGMVDVIFADVAQPDQSRIVGLNANHFLKNGGWFVISIKANCVDSTAKPEVVYAQEVQVLREQGCKPKEQLTLEPYHRDHAIVSILSFSLLFKCLIVSLLAFCNLSQVIGQYRATKAK